MLLELVSELAETDAQELGCARLHPAGPGQGHLEIAPLDLVQHRLQVDPIRRDLHRDLLDFPGDIEVGWKRLGFQHVAASENESPLDDVLELPDIAGPPIALENHQRLRADAPDGLAELGGDFPDEVRGQYRDV